MQDVQLFQGTVRKVILLAIIKHISFLRWGGGVLLSLELFLFPPPLRFAEGKKEGYGRQFPPDACDAICLSFQSLVKF